MSSAPAAKKPRNKKVTISISGLPEDLLQEIEQIAKEEHRPRSGQIVKFLEGAVKARVKADSQLEAA